MSGEAYAKRYPGGFVDLPSQTTPIDSQFLNAVESALTRILGVDPTDQGVQVWDAALGRMKSGLITNTQVAPAAAISRTKLDFGPGLVDADIAPGAAIASSKIAGLSGGASPPGAMILYGGTVAPSGWLMCDGSLVSRATQAGIFSVIGTRYGVGDGSTTFALPDFQGRVPVGVGTHADVGSLGLNDGVAVGSRRPKHSHSSTLTLPNHIHSFTDPGHVHNVLFSTGGGPSNVIQGVLGVSAAVAGVVQTGYTNITLGNPTTLPAIPGVIGQAGMTDSGGYLTVNVIIKT